MDMIKQYRGLGRRKKLVKKVVATTLRVKKRFAVPVIRLCFAGRIIREQQQMADSFQAAVVDVDSDAERALRHTGDTTTEDSTSLAALLIDPKEDVLSRRDLNRDESKATTPPSDTGTSTCNCHGLFISGC